MWLSLNIHYHMIFLDGVYVARSGGGYRFVGIEAPHSAELSRLVGQISERVGRHLERRGLLVRDAENAYLEWDGEEASPLDDLVGHAITYRVAVGPHRGQKAFTLQTVPAVDSDMETTTPVASASGFSLHAGVAAKAHQRDKLERLCRYISRPAVAEPRLSLTDSGHIRYSFKTPWRDGTTHVVFEPLDFIARLAALIPRPRVNLTRFHGIFAPNSRWRARITPSRRGKRRAEDKSMPAAEKHKAMTWARRLKRVFRIDVEVCEFCRGAVKIIACIDDPDVVTRILDHLKSKRRHQTTREPRAPPSGLFPGNVTKLH